MLRNNREVYILSLTHGLCYLQIVFFVLVGKTVSPGVAIDRSPSTQELMNLIQEARQYDEILAHQLETSKAYGFASNPQYGDYTLQTSAGQVAAVRALLDDMAKVV